MVLPRTNSPPPSLLATASNPQHDAVHILPAAQGPNACQGACSMHTHSCRHPPGVTNKSTAASHACQKSLPSSQRCCARLPQQAAQQPLVLLYLLQEATQQQQRHTHPPHQHRCTRTATSPCAAQGRLSLVAVLLRHHLSGPAALACRLLGSSSNRCRGRLLGPATPLHPCQHAHRVRTRLSWPLSDFLSCTLLRDHCNQRAHAQRTATSTALPPHKPSPDTT